ncbi:YjjG family noncanonical pyrimidine nucleotidase [Staphylococcus massiliensis]|uniref:Putative haloacid dehalogenase-like hydrolase n=1 Tax=Staphylococcus massiliensis S46 TaxID=1229783 RepID=K9ASL0_9STAP|nr:YjjG family noncanonical pyrimidine nucleotidase [Staphylococcus massiliensis]EKU50368.1 putative haloacid dehalogenase-like hydrolase [Staphylococcus massiliensis S46]
MTFKVVLLDFDDTIVNFDACEYEAYRHLMDAYQLDFNDQSFRAFQRINQAHWEKFQAGILTKEEVLTKRFIETFKTYGMDIDGVYADETFRKGLELATITYHEQALEVIQALSKRVRLFIVTNGATKTQWNRIERSPIMKYVDQMFVSEETGSHKPNVAFFDYVFERIPVCPPLEEILIVGDSLTSDIQGGIRAGIQTCWFNHRFKSSSDEIQPTYEIHHLNELLQLV